MKKVGSLLLAAAMFGCDETGGSPVPDAGLDAGLADTGSSDNCPLDANGKLLLQDLVAKTFLSTVHTVQNSHGRERGFALQLLGASEGNIGTFFLISECTGPELFDPYCDVGNMPPEEPQEPFLMQHDRCSRLSCEAAGIGIAEVYLTMRPNTAPDQRHRFTYDLEMPAGSASYDPNPYIRYRVDQRVMDQVVVTATLAANISVSPASGGMLDFSYSGQVRGEKLNDEIQSISINFTLPSLVTEGAIEVDFTVRADHTVEGGVLLGGSTLAGIGMMEERPIVLEWSEECR